MKEKILKTLEAFQDAYSKRDPNQIDHFMNQLFDQKDLVIFGTGLREVCINEEQSRALFLSDWESWGDYKLDMDSIHIESYDGFDYAELMGTVTYHFSDDEQTYDKFVGYVRENMESGSTYDILDVEHFLSHLLHPRDEKKRTYAFPIRTSFVFDQACKIRRIVFSIVNHGLYKDVRFEDIIPYHRGYDKDIDLIKSAKQYEKLDLNNLSFVEDGICVDQKAIKHTKHENDKLLSCFGQDVEVTINEDVITYQTSEHHKFFNAYGIIKKHTTQEALEQNLKTHILNILDSDLSSKEKLFKVRRDIALTYKEIALGTTFTWPIRIHGIMVNHDQTWYLKHVAISDPFNVILEGKE
jgi:hypothetical protein